jgi:putative ABC transport system permease protein
VSVLVRSTWRDLARQRWTTLSIGLTMFLGVALFGASYDAFLNLETSYERTYERLAFADLTVTGGDVDTVAAAARASSGVDAVTVRRTVDLPLRIGSDHILLGRLVELVGTPDVGRVALLDGSIPTAPDRAMVERHLADHFDLAPGSAIELYGGAGWQRWEVAAIVASPEYLWPARSRQDLLTSPDDFGVVFATPSSFDALDPDGAVAEVVLTFAPGGDPATVTDELMSVAAEAGSTVLTRAEQPSNAALQEDVAGFGELSLMFPVLFLGAGALATFVILSRLVRARRSEIATLRANGMSTRRVAGHFLGRGVLLAATAGTLGVVAGLVAGRWVTALYTAAIDVPDTVIGFHPGTAAAGLAMAVLAGGLAAGAPAIAAARISPGAALRGTVPPGRAGRSLIERLVPPVRRLPTRWRMVLRGIGRDPRRSLSTVVGVILSLVLVLAAWGMLDTVEILLDRQFAEVQRQDAELVVDVDGGDDAGRDDGRVDDVVAAVRAVPGVAAVERSGRVRVTIASDTASYATELIAFEPGTEMHGFGTTGPPTVGLVVGRSIRDLLGVDVGDIVTLSAADTASQTLPIEGFVDEPLGTLAYGRPDTIASLVESAGRSTVLVRFDDRVPRDEMRAKLTAVPGVVAYVDSRALYDTAQQLMGLFRAFVGVMLAFGALMSSALIVATTSANAAERSVELAALRVNGASEAELGRLLGAENLVLTALAIAPGLVVGWAVAVVFMGSFSSDLFDFGLHIRATTFLYSALAVLAVSVVAQWPAIRVLGRLDVARVVRERAG